MNLTVSLPSNTSAPRPTARLLAAAAMFGLDVDSFGGQREPLTIELPIVAGEIILICGPSGAGKSTLLRAAVSQAVHRGIRVLRPANLAPRSARATVIDLFREPVDRVVRSLARAGLAEARILGMPVTALSDGQRFRLKLARLMLRADRCRQPAIIAIDEFASGLDRATTHGVCRSIARWLRRTPHTLIVAGCGDLLGHVLEPECIVAATLHAPPMVISPQWGACQSTRTYPELAA